MRQNQKKREELKQRKKLHKFIDSVDKTNLIDKNKSTDLSSHNSPSIGPQVTKSLKKFVHETPIEFVDFSTPKIPDSTPSLKERALSKGVSK